MVNYLNYIIPSVTNTIGAFDNKLLQTQGGYSFFEVGLKIPSFQKLPK